MQHYGDAALIFATHDGYPQIVNALLYNKDLGARRPSSIQFKVKSNQKLSEEVIAISLLLL